MKLDDKLFRELLVQAQESPRKRSHQNLHNALDEPVQRLCIGLVKGTYVRPHHHPKSNKWELMLALKGAVMLVIFDELGKVDDRIVLGAGDSVCGMEMRPNTWHTVFPISDDAIIFEVKEGPYTPAVASDFASWAPEEGSEGVPAFLAWLESAKVGQAYIPVAP